LVRVDLHMHSSASFDGRMHPTEVAQTCRQVGLSPVVLTDHDTIEGARMLVELGESVVVGQEVLTTEGELIGLFLKEAIPKLLSPEEAIATIRKQGGLVYLEHPYDTSRRNLREEAIERVARQIDIVEVFNGRSGPQANRRAEELRGTLGAAAGAGSDAHTLAEIGRVYVEMELFTNAQDFLEKLRTGRVVIASTHWLGAVRRRLFSTRCRTAN
jgi:predicted metal-dependent phosphoesterase TrpH